MAEEELGRLKFSIKEIGYVSSLIRHHMRSISSEDNPKTVRKLLKKLKDDDVFWKDWFQLKIADTKGNLKKKNLDRSEIKKIVIKIRNELKPPSASAVLSIQDLAVTGKDVMDILNIEPGPRVGEVLRSLLDHVIDNPELNNKAKLIELMRKL